MVDHYEIQNRTVINLKTVDRNGVLHVNVCLFIYLFKHPPARPRIPILPDTWKSNEKQSTSKLSFRRYIQPVQTLVLQLLTS